MILKSLDPFPGCSVFSKMSLALCPKEPSGPSSSPSMHSLDMVSNNWTDNVLWNSLCFGLEKVLSCMSRSSWVSRKSYQKRRKLYQLLLSAAALVLVTTNVLNKDNGPWVGKPPWQHQDWQSVVTHQCEGPLFPEHWVQPFAFRVGKS